MMFRNGWCRVLLALTALTCAACVHARAQEANPVGDVSTNEQLPLFGDAPTATPEPKSAPVENAAQASPQRQLAANAAPAHETAGNHAASGGENADAPSSGTLIRRHSEHATVAKTESATDAGGGWLRTILSLAAVTGLILLLAWGYRAVSRGTGRIWIGRSRQPAVLDILARTSLTPKLGLCLVRVGPRVVLVGVSPERLTALDVVNDPELAARLAGDAAPRRAPEALNSATGNATVASPQFVEMLTRENEALDADDVPDESPNGARLIHLREQLRGAVGRLRDVAGRKSG